MIFKKVTSCFFSKFLEVYLDSMADVIENSLNFLICNLNILMSAVCPCFNYVAKSEEEFYRLKKSSIQYQNTF